MVLWSLVAASWAFPLNAPDPDDMEGFRCVYQAMGDKNNAPPESIVEATVPPGKPVYPTGLKSDLLPHATDSQLRAAARGKMIETVPAVASLATGGIPSRLVCGGSRKEQHDFYWGCGEKAFACTLHLPVGDKTVQVQELGQIGPRLSPITRPKEAVGLLALLDRNVFLPLSPREVVAWADEAEDYKVIEPEAPWVEIEKRTKGWLVHLTRRARCGCERDIVRRAYWVSDDGRMCQLEEKALVIAQATGACEAP